MNVDGTGIPTTVGPMVSESKPQREVVKVRFDVSVDRDPRLLSRSAVSEQEDTSKVANEPNVQGTVV